jgi:hypothetical protein
MKYLWLIVLLAFSLSSLAQVKIGLTFGANAITDRDEVMYIDNPLNFGGEAGVNLSVPLFNKRLAIESGLLFYDNYYRLRGPEVKVWFTDEHGSFFKMDENMNDFGLNVPVTLAWNKGSIRPFVGAQFQQSLSSSRVQKQKLGGISVGNPLYFYAIGWDVIELSSFTWYLNAGLYYVCSPNMKLKFEYALGMNDFVTHSISPKIINGENLGTTVQSSRINKFQVALVYTPSWGKKEQKKQKENKTKRSLKDNIKDIYQ